ncbi:uncharacterized protein LOC113861229 [Abrus precatorius]|uniref:Uncharacterized protein LOC113861229 n=1 Tax=Abrus precatorius TaxID=3816 RepID=A0A8B8L0E0_ABRPR|nr:uncharacterized protein LOC113861229 [Abrus precatorius]XP_027349717.1 uncharacterized protein LOC113861229 [Abrus precatorius]
MLLRSSSTPVLGSLLSSFTDSPSNNIHSETSHAVKHLPPTSVPQHYHKLSIHPILSSFSCGSSPISPSIAELERQNKSFRRVQSEGNLQDLAFSSCNNNEDRFEYSDPPKWFSARNRCLVLETIPSVSTGKGKGLSEEEEDEETESDIEYEERGGGLRENQRKDDGFSVVNRGNDMILSEEVRVKDGVCRVSFGDQEVGSDKEMFLAKGLGVDVCGDGIGGCIGGGGGSGGDDHNHMGSGGHDGDRQGVEEYYKRMVKENPCNPLFLRNYANFLYQCKQDREGAEEYYSRAILADPNDGEVLSQYGKLVWELHHDQERASTYFERAVQASPEDSHVQAAYASFLWDTEDDSNEPQCLPHSHQGAMATAGA